MYKIYTGIDYTDQHNYPNASVQIHRSFFLSIKACKRNSEEYMGKYLTISYIEHTKYQSTKKKNNQEAALWSVLKCHFLPETCLLMQQSTTTNDRSVFPIQLPFQISERFWEQWEATVIAKNS